MNNPTPATEVKATLSTEALTLEQRIRALELGAKTWYEKHMPAILSIAGLIVGFVLGHVVRG